MLIEDIINSIATETTGEIVKCEVQMLSAINNFRRKDLECMRTCLRTRKVILVLYSLKWM